MKVKKKPTTAKARRNYHREYAELVRTAAEQGMDAIDSAKLREVCFEVERSKEQFRKDVNLVSQRNQAIVELREIRVRETKLKEMEVRLKKMNESLEEIRQRYVKEMRPVEVELAKLRNEYANENRDIVSDRGEAMRQFMKSDPDGLLMKRGQWEGDLEQARRKLVLLHRENPGYNEMKRRELLRSYTQWTKNNLRWKRGEPWPAWASDDAAYQEGDLPRPTKERKAECKKRLDRLLAKLRSRQEIANDVTATKERIERLTAQIAAIDKQIYG